jgi:hypothetical protein
MTIPTFVLLIEEADEDGSKLVIEGTGATWSAAIEPLVKRIESQLPKATISSGGNVEVVPAQLPPRAMMLNLEALAGMDEAQLNHLIMTVPGLNALYHIGFLDGYRRRDGRAGPTA